MNVLDYEHLRPEPVGPVPRRRDAAALIVLLSISVLSFITLAIIDREKTTVVFGLLFWASDATMAVLVFKWSRHVWLSFAIPAWIWFWFGVVSVLALYLSMHQ
jgi:hypothetical protein